jgi:hypothetical protein
MVVPRQRYRLTGRAALIANTVDLVAERQAHRRRMGDSINATVRALLEQVDFDHVKPHSLLEAFRVLLAGLPTGALADVSNAASAERKILAECIDDRELGVAETSSAMTPADRQLVSALEGLRSNPEAVRAAADLIAALCRRDPATILQALASGDAGDASEVP